jgi:RHH-type proline utilization regulon transcriptional repressor/proline dehydrogenase/delta 1-pyrroline-5-carboxylate dehydrogenase
MSAATQPEIEAVGRALHRAMPSDWRSPSRLLDGTAMRLATRDPALQAALFRFVDVAPACEGPRDLAIHLAALLAEIPDPPAAVRLARALAERPAARAWLGRAAAASVRRMARRFILAESTASAGPALAALWRDGTAISLDLLGEATVTAQEAGAYAARCAATLRELARQSAGWPARPHLERDSHGPLPRANLAVKLSALTPLLRPEAPAVGRTDALTRLRPLLRLARELGAHLHLDTESLDSREAVLTAAYEVLAEPEFRDGPSAGVVVQAYLRDSPEQLEETLAFARTCGRTVPLTVRLVKGAYWDHELVLARQHGWPVPVFADRGATDRNFEALTVRLLSARPLVRPAIASHNLRSVAHAIATSRAMGAPDTDLELQVLRGLGDPLGVALAGAGLRVRAYCPVGGLVAGMAYLVRRLLENASQNSFLQAQAQGVPLGQLLRPPEPMAG